MQQAPTDWSPRPNRRGPATRRTHLWRPWHEPPGVTTPPSGHARVLPPSGFPVRRNRGPFPMAEVADVAMTLRQPALAALVALNSAVALAVAAADAEIELLDVFV